jgi:hypothetical protein
VPGMRESPHRGNGGCRSASCQGFLSQVQELGVASQAEAGGGDSVMTTPEILPAKQGHGGTSPGEVENPILDQAVELHRLGYWVVAIRAPGESLGDDRTAKGKEPIGKGWGLERWSESKLRRELSAHPNRGIGIQFGPGRAPGDNWSIDLEGDGPQAAHSLTTVLGSDQELLTPAWDSRRGGHTIFVTSEANGRRLLDLLSRAGATESKEAGKAGVWHLDAFPDLEWRIGGYKPNGTVKQVQSVVPPTPGEDGIPRVWRTTPDTRVLELPDSVFAVLEASIEMAEERAAIQAEATESQVNKHHHNGNGVAPRSPFVRTATSGPSAEERAAI